RMQTQTAATWNDGLVHPAAAHLEYLYAWERRCRGYDLFPEAVELEPAFVPYGPLNQPPSGHLYGQQSLGTSGFDVFTRRQPNVSSLANGGSNHLCGLTLRLPLEQKVTPHQAEGILAAWGSLPFPVSFEIIGTPTGITYQVMPQGEALAPLAAGLQVHLPVAEIEPAPDILRQALAPLKDASVGYQVVDFGLREAVYQPLKPWSSFPTDPHTGIVGALAQLQAGEVAGVQVLLSATRQPWAESILRLAADFAPEGTYPPYHSLESEPQRQARQKLSGPLLACGVRVFAVSPCGDARAFELCQRVGGALAALAEPGGNSLLALSNRGETGSGDEQAEGYILDDETHFQDVLHRTTHRPGMLLSAAELVGLVHPPTEKLIHPKLVRLDERERPLPEHLAAESGVALGIHRFRQQEQSVVWPDRFRTRHAYLLGATRMGKSTLLLNLIAQDMAAGGGLCIIDPHGDLAQDVLSLIPEERQADAYYVDFSDRDYPVAMGLLESHDEWEQQLLASDVLSILRRLFAASWGDRLEHILRHVLLTLLAQPGHTLRDIRPLLADKAYREQVLPVVNDPDLLAFWQSEFPGYSQATFAPIYNKLGLLLSSPLVRNIVAQPKSRLHLSSLIAGRKILIVNLAQSLVGEDNAHFLGALLVSKIQIAAMQSLRHQRGSRTPFTLYVDEFQHFVVSSFEKILSEAGKAGLSLVMANQFLEQLNEHLQAAILGNVGTLVSFRVSSDSARALEKEFGGRFAAEDIVDLGRGQAIARIGQARDSVRIATFPPPQPAPGTDAQALLNVIVEQTRQTSCRPRVEIEAELAQELRQRQEQQEQQQTDVLETGAGNTKSKARKQGTAPQSGQTQSAGATSLAPGTGLTEPQVFGLVEGEEIDPE
ncbi:MAG: TraM recognition domain-containing protein, partial [Abitibacteriaceae bacterium]|nr:TraM recognition domain-containing protein [Abditibacteriaceae bacterium]